ncbi:MAG: tyrosine-type recombinase/integrase [Methylotenera sp.]|nr:tyrosine-type recombinase/integrase [Methylotenera sp.]
MSNHLEKASNGYNWNAILNVPTELQGVDGLPKLRFKKSTRTTDKREACTIASQYVAGWKLLIEKAKGNDTGFLADAIRFRDDIEKAQDAEHREDLKLVLHDHAERIEQTHGLPKAEQFCDVAMGVQTLNSLHFDGWRSQLHHVQKTQDQMVKDVKTFIEQIPLTSDITFFKLRDWIEGLEAKGATYSTRKRLLGSAKDFWKYLKQRRVLTDLADPFVDVLPPLKRGKNTKSDEWLPFKPDEVVTLWHSARTKRKPDLILADLIALSAYTGCRIEELCSLKIKDMADGYFRVTDAKTTAGNRDVPIHSAIASLVTRLKKQSSDGYLLSGLTFNKYDDRSNAIGKRFGRLKTKLGHDELHVHHSIRKTLVTMLENAGVTENNAADIVGHDKPRITFGLYSDGAWLDVKVEALERVKYNFPELT